MHIANHKYKPGKYTPLDNILNPWWLFLTEKLPRRLAPNLVTFAGFLPIVTSYISAWYYSPDFTTPPPRWLCFSMAVSLFMYQTLDAMDGKQARRINCSTPLGQLFDHGCDAMACLSHHSMAAAVFLPGATRWTLAGLAVLQTGFFLAQWQEHYTGVLRTSYGSVGVTETQYALMGLSILAGIIGPNALQALMSTVIFGKAFTVSNLLILGWVVFNYFLMAICLHDTFTFEEHGSDVTGKAIKDGPRRKWKRPSIMRNHESLAGHQDEALQDLVPVVLLNIILLFGWSSDIVEQMPRVLCLSFGLLCFFLTAQMIVFSMAGMHFRAFQPTMIPFALLAFASKYAYLPFEMTAVKVTLIVYTGALLFHVLCWLLTVIDEIKTHLGIFIFTVDRVSKD